MKEFTEKDEEIIKQMQLAILKYTSDLSAKTRSKVFSRFQALKYYFIDASEAEYKIGCITDNISAFYLSDTHEVYIIKNNGKNDFDTKKLIHEMIHAVSQQDYKNKTKIGIGCYKYGGDFYSSHYTYYRSNIGINEGLTEYFANETLKKNNMVAYHDFVSIVSIMCKECGELGIKECYFNNDTKGLKDIIKKTYHLKDNYLVDKLFLQMDNLLNYNYFQKTREAGYGFNPIFSEIYKTFLKMKITKIMYEHKKDIKKQADVFKFLDIPKYLTSGKQFENMRLADDEIFLDLEKNKLELLNDRFDSESYKDIPSFISVYVKKMLKEDCRFLNVLKYKKPRLALKALSYLNSVVDIYVEFRRIDNSKFVGAFLNSLTNDDDKIELDRYTKEEKYEFITNAIYCTFDLDPKPYNYFYPKDLVEYISHGQIEWDEFYDTDAIDYLYDEIKKQHKEKLFEELFDDIYLEVKENREKHGKIDKSQSKKDESLTM